MKIEISQTDFGFFSNEYEIKINRKHTHSAFVNFFFLGFNGIDLVEAGSDIIILRINKISVEIGWNYQIIAPNEEEYFFSREDFLGFEYRCESEKDIYKIYSHNDRKRSIFKNDVQVAWWDKEGLTFGGADYYDIIADNDCNYKLLIAMCVILDHIETRNNGAISFNMGNPFADLPKFDKNWKPKS